MDKAEPYIKKGLKEIKEPDQQKKIQSISNSIPIISKSQKFVISTFKLAGEKGKICQKIIELIIDKCKIRPRDICKEVEELKTKKSKWRMITFYISELEKIKCVQKVIQGRKSYIFLSPEFKEL